MTPTALLIFSGALIADSISPGPTVAALIGKLCDGRLGFMRRLRAWATFSRGWTRRVEAVCATALKMAATAGKFPVVQPVGISDKLPSCTRPGCPLAARAA